MQFNSSSSPTSLKFSKKSPRLITAKKSRYWPKAPSITTRMSPRIHKQSKRSIWLRSIRSRALHRAGPSLNQALIKIKNNSWNWIRPRCWLKSQSYHRYPWSSHLIQIPQIALKSRRSVVDHRRSQNWHPVWVATQITNHICVSAFLFSNLSQSAIQSDSSIRFWRVIKTNF